MTVTLQLANQVRRLGRENLTVAQIASRLALPEMAILEALTILALPLPGETFEQRANPTQGERESLLAKMPKRWQTARESATPCSDESPKWRSA